MLHHVGYPTQIAASVAGASSSDPLNVLAICRRRVLTQHTTVQERWPCVQQPRGMGVGGRSDRHGGPSRRWCVTHPHAQGKTGGERCNNKGSSCVFLLRYLSSSAQEAAKDIEEFEHLWVHEAKVLRSHYGAFDFSLPELKLTMEVDGEQHFQGKMFGALVHAVRRHDYEKTCEAWRQGCCMLRVPYFDAADFGAKLEEAIDYRSMFPTLHFIMWSTNITNTFSIF